ncbi:MAG: MAPEG family protein [Proteobacteria bacterium]|nr:MAPEG family protein [Pseudomonadota bacterium]
MSTELLYLTLSVGLTLILWVPYVLARVGTQGMSDAMGYPENPPAPPAWAKRSERVHLNMVENLSPFVALVLVAHVLGVSNEMTVIGATLFFWARVAYAAVYTFGIPYLRTLTFVVSWVGMALIFVELVF